MLARFFVKNFKSFCNRLSFDLTNVKNYEFNSFAIKNGIVNKAIIYGYNGSGKSNLGLAIFDIVTHLTDKERINDLYENYINALCCEEIAEFEYLFKFGENEILYKYGKRRQDDLVYESLSINDKKYIFYDRRNSTSAEILFAGTENLVKDLSLINISILKYVRSNAILKDEFEQARLNELFQFIDSMLLFWSLESRGYIGYITGTHTILNDIIDNNHFEDFIKFLKKVHSDSNIIFKDENGKKKIYFDFNGKLLDFWSTSSTGMHSLALFYFWLQRIKYEKQVPSLVFIDEFDAFYHHSLSEQIVKELLDNNCQVIITTHNNSLLSNDLIRPDCYFVLNKGKIKSLSDLTDKDIRYAHNLEKMYRSGVFDD